MIDRSPEQDTAVIRSREVADERWTHLKDAVDNAGNAPTYDDTAACDDSHYGVQVGTSQASLPQASAASRL